MAEILSIQTHMTSLSDNSIHSNGNVVCLPDSIALQMDGFPKISLSNHHTNGGISPSPNGNNHFAGTQGTTVEVEWKNLNYSVSQGWKKPRKKIVHNLSGRVCSGELTAIMGPSGSGKSTLMNILSGYVNRQVEGQVLVNGRERDLNSYKKLSCCIMQDDHVIGTLTVKEILAVATNLKIPSYVSKEQKKKIIMEVMESLGLLDCKDTRAGKLSGGQRKRLCIAQELVSNPPVIFLDEPTSGLDSSTCLQCINLLKSLARDGHTVVCTIHQPSARILEIFDKLYMLTEGNCIYRGPVACLIPFLNSQGLECPKYHNPADFITEVASGEYGEETVNKLVETVHLLPGDSWTEKNVQTTSLDDDKIEEPSSSTALLREKIPIFRGDYKGYATSSCTQFGVLLIRVYKMILRDQMLSHLRLVSHLLVGVLLGLLYYNIGNQAHKIYNNAAFLFFTLLFLMFAALMPTILTFPLEMNVFIREHLNGWYSTKVYFLAKTLADLPFQIMFPVLYSMIVYWLTAQPLEPFRFTMFTLLGIATALVGQALGLVIGTAVDIQNAVYLGPLLCLPIVLFSGFFIAVKNMPLYLNWISYLSFFRYAYEGMMTVIYGYKREEMECHSDYFCIFINPSDFLFEMGTDDVSLVHSFGILAAFFIIFRILGFIVLKMKLYFRQ